VDLVVTFTGVEIVHYHVGLSGSGMTDSVHITFHSVDVEWLDSKFNFTWQLPT
jgi:type VI protein secretion system component Hcp